MYFIHSLVEGLESTLSYDYTKYHPMDEVRVCLLYRCFQVGLSLVLLVMLIRDCTNTISALSPLQLQ